jgi:hypothetical protein
MRGQDPHEDVLGLGQVVSVAYPRGQVDGRSPKPLTLWMIDAGGEVRERSLESQTDCETRGPEHRDE